MQTINIKGKLIQLADTEVKRAIYFASLPVDAESIARVQSWIDYASNDFAKLRRMEVQKALNMPKHSVNGVLIHKVK